jgi:hypothetical protein
VGFLTFGEKAEAARPKLRLVILLQFLKLIFAQLRKQAS